MDKQLVAISFAGGIDTKTDKYQVLPSKLLDLQNGIFQNTGAINKRWGYKRLGQSILGQGTATIGSAFGLNAFGNELLLYDGLSAYGYAPARDAWVSRGSIVSVIASNQSIVRNSNQQLSPDFGTAGGVEVYAWEDTRGGIRYSVLDAATGEYLLLDQPIYVGAPSTLTRPKVLAFPAAGLILVFFSVGNGQIAYITINPLNPLAMATGYNAIGSNVATPSNNMFDVCLSGTGTYFYAVWYSGSALSPGVFYTQHNATLQETANGGIGASTTPANGAIAVCSDPSDNFYILYVDTTVAATRVQWVAKTPANTGLTAGSIIDQATGPIRAITGIYNATAGALFVYAEALGSQTYNQVIYSNTLAPGGILGTPMASAPVFRRSVGLASKPFVYAGNVYVNVAYQSNLQSTYFTLDGAGRVVCQVNPTLGGGLVQNSDYVLPECPQVSPGIFKWSNLVKGQPNTAGGVVFSLLGVNATKQDFIDSNAFLSANIAGNLYTVGGVVQSYDGAQYVEHGFLIYPENIATTPAGAGGNLGTGTYNYVVVYEWPDNAGKVQRSTPSVVYSVTFGSGTTNQVTHTIPTLRLTKKVNVKIVVYRTQANGQLLTRVTSALTPIYNDPTVDTVTFVDTQSDAAIASNEACYTQPLLSGQGNPVLNNAAPPACSLIAAYADRLFVAGLDNKNQLAYTKPQAQNLPMEFVATQLLNSEPDGGAITAIVRMDDKLVVFKRYAIFYLVGQGPSSTGDNNDFGDLVQVPSGGVGCATANSVVLTPVGLMFDSGNGIYLLDRGLNVSFKGAPVQALTSGVTITSATVIPNQWVVFTTNTDNAIVYDFFYDQWSRFSNHQGVDSVLFAGGGNLFAYANSAGKVFLQTPTTFQDDLGKPIVLSLTTAWITLDAIQGYQRIYEAFLLGTYKGTHVLNVAIGQNYNELFTGLAVIPSDPTLGVTTFGSSSPFGAEPLFGAGSDPEQHIYQFRVDVLRKVQAIRFQISDQQSAPGNEGFSLSVLSLRVGKKRPGFRLPAVKQFGGA